MYDTKEARFIHAFVSKSTDAINEADHSINFVVSTDVVDRDNEMVMAEAVYEAIHQKDQFYANPICPPCHKPRLDSGMPPCVGHWDTDTAKLLKHRVEMRLIYDMKNTIGKGYWEAYSGRHMRAVSIGFRIVDGHEDTKDGKRIYIITKIELYEISCVGVGANQQALAKLKALGCRQGDGCRQESDVDEKALPQRVADFFTKHFDDLRADITEQIDELKDLLITDPDGLAEKLMLGKQSEPSGRGADNETEQVVRAFQKVLKEILPGE